MVKIQDWLTSSLTERQCIQATSCRGYRDLVRAVGSGRRVQWPNSAACLLERPLLLVLFRPSEVAVFEELESWLDRALCAEVGKAAVLFLWE